MRKAPASNIPAKKQEGRKPALEGGLKTIGKNSKRQNRAPASHTSLAKPAHNNASKKVDDR